MNKTQEALELALEALEEIESYYGYDRSVGAMASSMYEASNLAKITSTRIREALAEQPAQQRPQNCGTGYCSCIECLFEQPAQPSKPWVGLTEAEHTQIAVECGCISADWVFYGAAVERKLREKNA